jgi:hypothetical protein
MAEPTPKRQGKGAAPGRAAARPAAADGPITEPLTPDKIDELGTGGPWKDDEEFERWMEDLATSRKDDAAA